MPHQVQVISPNYNVHTTQENFAVKRHVNAFRNRVNNVEARAVKLRVFATGRN